MYSLDQLVRSGKVRYIGGSTMPAYKFAQMVDDRRLEGLCPADRHAEPLQHRSSARKSAR